MRTTVNINDEVLEKVREYAQKRGISLGHAVSDLLYDGIEAQPKFKKRNGFTILELPPGSPKVITTEMIKKIEDDYWEEEARRAFAPRL